MRTGLPLAGAGWECRQGEGDSGAVGNWGWLDGDCRGAAWRPALQPAACNRCWLGVQREATAACPADCNRCWLAWVRRRGTRRPSPPTALPCRLPASAIRVSRLGMGVCMVCEQRDYLTGGVEVESGLPIWAGPSDGDTKTRTRLDCVAPVEFGCSGVRFDLT